MLIEKLERLVDAFEDHDVPVRSNLAPGATTSELAAFANRYEVELPDDYRAMYSWHNGHLKTNNFAEMLMFRDRAFMALGDLGGPQSWIDSAREYGDVVDGIVDLTTCLPFAGHSDAYVVPGASTNVSALSNSPVIAIGHGHLDVFYLSIEAMVDTCIEWVEQTDWEFGRTAPNEYEIWVKHNPGVFPHRAGDSSDDDR